MLFSAALLADALPYTAYRALSADLAAQGRSTAADPHFNTPEMLAYTTLNQHRMRRLDRQRGREGAHRADQAGSYQQDEPGGGQGL